ncbi:MAG: hypothetical protein IPI67_26530 [Myxococcales bacterium]|nr:hypothetical protein [Myxococcales bacterium]
MSIEIELERELCEPGGVLRGRVVLTPLAGQEERKVELTVMWMTDGKGNTDLEVALFRVLSDGAGDAATGSHRFEVNLPLLPVSYTGTLLKLRWLVSVRRQAPLGGDQIEEKDFLVGWPA